MAQRRMFSKDIVESGAFMEMPLSTQALYFHLGMNADDDGFISNAKIIVRMCGAAEDDMRLLLAKRFLLAFDNGVLVVKHWKINNYIRSDRYRPTLYQDEYQSLYLKQNQAYSDHPECGLPSAETDGLPVGIPDDNQTVDNLDTQNSIGKDRLVYNILYSPEPKIDSEPSEANIPLNTGEEYPVYQKDIDEWQKLYPAVDVRQELNKMRGWCLANPSKRKTKRGVKKFINNWLSRQQDRGGTPGFSPGNASGLNGSRGDKKYKVILDENGFEKFVEDTD